MHYQRSLYIYRFRWFINIRYQYYKFFELYNEKVSFGINEPPQIKNTTRLSEDRVSLLSTSLFASGFFFILKLWRWLLVEQRKVFRWRFIYCIILVGYIFPIIFFCGVHDSKAFWMWNGVCRKSKSWATAIIVCHTTIH